MMAHRLRSTAGRQFTFLCAALLLAPPTTRSQDKDKRSLDKIPSAVMDALKAKFPKAEIRKWTKEREGDDLVYDIEFKEDGRACEADIRGDGTYINYEKAIAATDLPAAVTKAIERKFPKATLKEIMEETEVEGNDENLSAYEVVLVTASMRTVEIRLAPDGTILEEEVLSTKKETGAHDMPDAVFKNYADLKWERILPDLGENSPEICVLHVEPKTKATKLLIRTPHAIHIRKHWHSGNETHTMIVGTAAFACDGKRVEQEPGSFNYLPAKMVHEAWTSAESVVFITVDGPWDVNWVEGAPTAADLIK